jgi:hypothetical protein
MAAGGEGGNREKGLGSWLGGSLALPRFGAEQAEVGFVDEVGGLQRLPRLLLGQPGSRELSELVVYQRQELLGSQRIALLHGREDASNVAHSPPA